MVEPHGIFFKMNTNKVVDSHAFDIMCPYSEINKVELVNLMQIESNRCHLIRIVLSLKLPAHSTRAPASETIEQQMKIVTMKNEHSMASPQEDLEYIHIDLLSYIQLRAWKYVLAPNAGISLSGKTIISRALLQNFASCYAKCLDDNF